MHTRDLIRTALFCSVSLLPARPALAQQRPTLDSPTLNPQGIQLVVHGQHGTNYAIEISRNLNSWLPLFSQTATNGEADFQYSPGTNTTALFFRARPDVKLPPVTVSIAPDPNQQTVGLLDYDNGGALSFTDNHGIGWTLMVPPKAVIDSQVLTMTVITNLTGLPFASGALGAVAFDVDNLRFSEPAQLIIQFPDYPPTDLRKVVPYGFDQNGSYLRLVPSLTLTNSIIVPLAGLSAIGCSIATLDEILQQGRRLVADTNLLAQTAITKNGPVAKNNFSDSCFPADKTRATFVSKGVENAVRIANQNIAEKMAAAAQAPEAPAIQDLGLVDDMNSVSKENLEPFTEEMKTNCALAQALLPYILGNERQSELLGFEPRQIGLQLCPTYSICAQKIGECCKIKGASEQAWDELIRLTKNWQLMGCDTPDPEQYCPDCFPAWYGKLTYQDTHNSYQVGDGFELDSQYRISATFNTGFDLLGSPSGSGYYGISGTLSGSADGKTRTHTKAMSNNGCNSYLETLKTSAIATPATIGIFRLVWALTNTPPGLPQNGMLLFPDPTTAAKLATVTSDMTTTDVTSLKDNQGNCIQQFHVSTSHLNDSYVIQQATLNSPDIIGTINDITGTYTTNWTAQDGSAWSRAISWDFHRKQQ